MVSSATRATSAREAAGLVGSARSLITVALLFHRKYPAVAVPIDLGLVHLLRACGQRHKDAGGGGAGEILVHVSAGRHVRGVQHCAVVAHLRIAERPPIPVSVVTGARCTVILF